MKKEDNIEGKRESWGWFWLSLLVMAATLAGLWAGTKALQERRDAKFSDCVRDEGGTPQECYREVFGGSYPLQKTQ